MGQDLKDLEALQAEGTGNRKTRGGETLGGTASMAGAECMGGFEKNVSVGKPQWSPPHTALLPLSNI